MSSRQPSESELAFEAAFEARLAEREARASRAGEEGFIGLNGEPTPRHINREGEREGQWSIGRGFGELRGEAQSMGFGEPLANFGEPLIRGRWA